MDYAKQQKAVAIIRGMRAISDFENEFQMALMNRRLNRDVQTIFLMTGLRWIFTSSSIIKEVATFGGDISGMAPGTGEAQNERKIQFNGGPEPMDLWQLKVFTSVVKEKSFSKAGETIFLSQPTVSSHIKDLETHFGCQLIDRLGREAVPTKAGELLHGYALKMLQLKEDTEAAISHFLGHAKGHLIIGWQHHTGGVYYSQGHRTLQCPLS